MSSPTRRRPLALLGAAALAAVPALTTLPAPAAHAATTTAAATTSPATATAATTAAPTMSPCNLVTSGRVAGLRTRPAHVTFALSAAYGVNSARVTRCTKRANGTYAQTWTTAGHVGRAGYAPAGAKREGDGRSPSGVYRLGTAFGAADPGSHVGYLRLRPTSCWGSTVGAKTYNRYFVGRCGKADESMYDYVKGAYAQGLVVEYNTAPVRQGLGSAIFLHVSTGGATAGCVSIPLPLVRSTVTDTRAGDVIVMGVAADAIRPAGRVTSTLAPGSRSAAVRVLQARLRELGYRVTDDGVFAASTRSAVVAFQTVNRLGADGVVGPATGRALRLR